MRKTAKWLVIAMLLTFMATPVQTGWAEEAANAEPCAEQEPGMACESLPDVQELLPEAQEPVAEQAQHPADDAEASESNPTFPPEAQTVQSYPAENAAPDTADAMPATEEPAEAPTPAPEATLATAATVLPEEEAAQDAQAEEIGCDLSNIQITIWLDWEGTLSIGDTVLLKSRIEGLQPDDYYTMQWQYFDGSQWNDAPGATTDTCSITVNETNAGYLWRLAVKAA